MTTWGEIPEEATVPEGGRFLLVTEAHEKVCKILNTNEICENKSASCTHLKKIKK